jgi:RNA polymerase sigma-70 factor (ECF subfamily)
VSRIDIPAGADDVELAREGDVDAFERLYRTNVGRVYGLCLRMVADRSLAEDLAQEVFIRAWQKLGTFRGESAFTSWLHRLAVNVVLSRQRGRRRRESRVVAVDDLETYETPERPRGASQAGSALDLEKAVATLPAGARRVFLLHDVEGFSHREIATLTGIAEGTSKAHLHRARRLLREVLER